jgi:radical SAM protein with 4Fe4S-binding SPASM domain
MAFAQSYVISWNITRRCNERCEHCYIEAGAITREDAEGELSTEECLDVVDQLALANPEALLILTGGEPLLRKDVFQIARRAADRGLWPVVGTNGVLIDDRVTERMIAAGVRGVSLSLDALEPAVHDRFRGVKGAWQNTVDGSRILSRHGLPFIVQTTVGDHNAHELEAIARLAYELGARVFNVYFLVPTGRGAYVSDIPPQRYEELMQRLIPLQREHAGKMLVNSKCAPHYQRVLYEHDPESPFLKTFASGAGGCPAGTHYAGIRPDGQVTPCPYLPVYAGNLREQSFKEIWDGSELFRQIRARNQLGGRCGSCEFTGVCGGCRARAYGATGDFMAEDPWCVYEPGRFGGKPIRFDDKTTYGSQASATELGWDADAEERLRGVPAFVRPMVRKRVESYAREHGHTRVTAALMAEVRSQVAEGRIGQAPSFVRRLLGGS